MDVASVTDLKQNLRKGTLIIWEYHGGPNQQFYINQSGDKTFKIINSASGFSIEVP